MSSILIVEDEQTYRETLAFLLQQEHFTVHTAADGLAGFAAFQQHQPDVVLLDVMLPKLSGIEVCRKIREVSQVPIIMVSARDEEVDKVLALELGADDYVTKPFSARELVARIHVLLRRQRQPAPETQPDTAVLSAGSIRMDPLRHEVTVRGELVPLPLKEFVLLQELMAHRGRVLTRAQLIDRVWGMDYIGDGKTLDVHIKRLRKKIEPTPSQPQYIHTVRGVGYRFEG